MSGPFGEGGGYPVGIRQVSISFSAADAPGRLICPIYAGEIVREVVVVISEAFDATISIGEPGASERLLARSEVNPGQVDTYSATPHYKYVASDNVYVYLSGATQGQGAISLIIYKE